MRTQMELDRRQWLARAASGVGSVALAGMLGGLAAAEPGNPLTAKSPHFKARAKRVIFLFMGGGPSHVDTFDPKPKLREWHGKEIPLKLPAHLRDASRKLLASPFQFAKHGDSGLEVSELFPEVAKHADSLCVIRSMHCDSVDHVGATVQTFTGQESLPRPSLGSWVLYGLGSECRDLPGFVVLGPDQPGESGLYSSRFLPACFQGTRAEWKADKPAAQVSPIPNLTNAGGLTVEDQKDQLELLRALNEDHKRGRVDTDRLNARTASFELALRMQAVAPDAFDLGKETNKTQTLYGLNDPAAESFGRRCLLARRLAERGVRFVQVQCGKGDKLDWDQHGGLEKGHRTNALGTDKPIAGLLADLKARGLLDDTLVVWAGEFGRSPTSQGKDGREHHPHGYSVWLAGGGVKAGHVHGSTDEFGWYAERDKVHIHDFHATILHLLGLDHEKLTHRYSGRDFRLTDVRGVVVKGVLA